MKAVVWHGIGDIRLNDVPMPETQEPGDAVIRLTASAISRTDLHFVRGTAADIKPGTVLGHEAVNIVEEIGANVRNPNIGCGHCPFCRRGEYARIPFASVTMVKLPDVGTPSAGLRSS